MKDYHQRFRERFFENEHGVLRLETVIDHTGTFYRNASSKDLLAFIDEVVNQAHYDEAMHQEKLAEQQQEATRADILNEVEEITERRVKHLVEMMVDNLPHANMEKFALRVLKEMRQEFEELKDHE